MKRFLMFFMAIVFFAIQGWSQTTLNEGFEGATFPPDDWRIETTNGSGVWTSSSTISHTGNKSARSGYVSGGVTRWLITPQLQVTASANSFSFWIATDDWYPDGDNVDIFVSTTDNAVASFGTTSLLALDETNINETWAQHTVDLSAYIGQNIYVAIRVIDYFGFATFIDDVTGPNLIMATCPKPTLLSVSNPTPNGIKLSWTDATGSLWNIQYMLSTETDWANATTISGVTANPYTFTTLNAATSYKARVKTDCSTEESEWSSTITFTTGCNPITTIPFSESFDNLGIVAGTFPTCWSRPILNTSTPFPSIVTAHHSAPASVKFQSASSSAPTYVITPPFADDINTLRVKFWLRADHLTDAGTMLVGLVSDPTDLTTFELVRTINPATTEWSEYEVMFNNTTLAGQNKYIAFKHVTSLEYNYYFLDDILVDYIPSCVKPTNLASSSITPSSAQIAWTPSISTDNSWWVFWKTSNASNYDSTLVSTNPYTLTGLSPASTYNVYAKTNCGTEVSDPSDIISFVTGCGTITSLPYGEGFNAYAAGTFPQCWSKVVGLLPYPQVSTSQYHSAPSSMEIRSSATFSTYVISPKIGLDIQTLQVRFWAKAESTNSSGTLEVGLMSDLTDNETFELVNTVFPLTNSWKEYEFTFEGATLQGVNKYIAFRQTLSNNWSYWLDDVEISFIPSCARPTALSSSNLTQTTANITFTPGDILDTEWKVFYRPFGTTTWAEDLANAIPHQITNLESNTIYEYYVKTVCSDASYSSSTTTLSFRTLCEDIIDIPYTESFDSYGTGSSATSYPTCWSRNVSNYSTINYPFISTTNFSPPGAMYFYSYNNTRVVAVCNPINSSIPINSLTVEFKMRYTSLDPNGIQVGVMTDPNDFSTFVPVGNPQTLSTANVWEDKVVMFSSYQGTGNYIALAAIAPSGQYSRAYVDDFKIDYTPTCPNVYDLTLGVVSTTSVSVDWDNSFVDPTGWNIAYAETPIASFNTATSTIVPIVAQEILPYLVSNLTPGSTYTFAVQNACGGNWSLPKQITLPLSAITLPYSQNFEDTSSVSEWSFASSNTTKTDMWCIGSAVGYPGNSMYVSSDGGLTNSYSQTVTYTYASALVEFGESAEFTLNFDWKAGGDGNDLFSIYVLPLSAPMPTNGYPLGGKRLLSPIGFQPNWQNKSIMLDNETFANTVQRLVFVWYSNYATISDPAVAIDNITIEGIDCGTPTDLVASNISQTSADISWTEIGGATSWQLYYKELTAQVYTSVNISTPSPYTLSGLTANTAYTMYIVANCGQESSNESITTNFRSECAPITSFPYSENFDSYGTGSQIMPACWVRTTTYADRPNISPSGRSGNCLYFYAPVGTYNIATMTPIDAAVSVNSLMARFYYKSNSATDRLIVGVMTDPTDANTFDSIATIQAPVTSTWAEYEVNFSSYTGLGQYIAFKNVSRTSIAYAYIDDLRVDYIPACSRPTSLSTLNITPTSADISFVPGEQLDSEWKVYYKAVGETMWMQDEFVSIPYQITGLDPNTEYEVYFKTLCSDYSYSDASNILIFRTECNAITTLPYTENFDTYGQGQSVMPACWVRNTSYSGYPYVASSGHTGFCLYFYAGIGHYNIAVMRAIDDAIPINTLTARFYYKNSTLTDRLVVGVMSDPSDATTFDSVTTIQSATTSSWAEYEVNFSTYAGEGQYIAFKNAYTTTAAYAYIDDLIVDLIPSCARPTSLSAIGVSDSMEVSFIPGNTTDAEWYIYYKPSLSSNWDSLLTTTTTTTISGLTLQTTYQIYVKNLCTGGVLSEATPIITYTTPCSDIAITSFPFTEGFENGFNCWTQDYVTGTVDWMINSPYFNAHTGTGFAYFNYEDYTGYKTKLISPILDITGLSSPYVSFWHTQEGWGQDQDKLKVLYRISTTSPWVELIQYDSSIANYRLDSIALPNPTPTYQIAFEGEQNYGFGIRLDDITVYNVSTSCTTPTNVTVVPTNVSANITWTAGGTETSWEVRLGSTGTPEIATVTNHTLSGLTPNTSYTVYVRANCGYAFSSWASATFFTPNIQTPPAVTTLVPIGQITQTTASLKGTYVLGTDTILTKGFEYKEASASIWNSQLVSNGTTPFTYSPTGLTANTAYEVKAFVTTASFATTYGNTVAFTTLAIIPPTVTTDSVKVLSETSATFYGKITENTEAIEARGFEYKLSSEAWEDAINISATGVSSISATPTTLTIGSYNVRAYARTLAGTEYGQALTFQTQGLSGIVGQEISIMMYPNPATSQTNLIVSAVNGETKITLSDVQGRTLNTISAKPVNGIIEKTIDLNNLAKGVYYIRIQNSEINKTQKLIIK